MRNSARWTNERAAVSLCLRYGGIYCWQLPINLAYNWKFLETFPVWQRVPNLKFEGQCKFSSISMNITQSKDVTRQFKLIVGYLQGIHIIYRLNVSGLVTSHMLTISLATNRACEPRKLSSGRCCMKTKIFIINIKVYLANLLRPNTWISRNPTNRVILPHHPARKYAAARDF